MQNLPSPVHKIINRAISLQRGNITHIQIDHQELGTQGMKIIMSFDWDKMITFNISGNRIADEGLQYLCKASWNNIQCLNMNCNRITAEGIKQMIVCDWTKLITLDISFNRINTQGILLLSNNKWRKLTIINLSGNSIGDRGCKYLTRAKWPTIKSIQLDKCNIEDVGTHHLSKAQTKQQIFDKDRNSIMKANFLVRANTMKLTELIFTGNILDESVIDFIKAQWPIKTIILNIKREMFGKGLLKHKFYNKFGCLQRINV